MARALKVFLSSTFEDLAVERQAVLDAIQRLDLEPAAMELFGASDQTPLKACLEAVRRSSLLVLLVGHRYGALVPELDISYSQAEYEEAQRAGIPCLVYLRDDEWPIPPKFLERNPERLGQLERFRDLLRSRHTVATFGEPDKLAHLVAQDVFQTVESIREADQLAESVPPRAQDEIVEQATALLADLLAQGVPGDSLLSAVRKLVSELLTSEGKRLPLLFLSHASQDSEFVRSVAARLSASELDVWIDADVISPGKSFVEEISRGLDAANFIVFFMSQASLSSGWARQELNIAMARRVDDPRGVVVLPVLLESVDVPPLLRDVLYIDGRDVDAGACAQQILRAIEAHRAA